MRECGGKHCSQTNENVSQKDLIGANRCQSAAIAPEVNGHALTLAANAQQVAPGYAGAIGYFHFINPVSSLAARKKARESCGLRRTKMFAAR
jgi:hypothetical protein